MHTAAAHSSVAIVGIGAIGQIVLDGLDDEGSTTSVAAIVVRENRRAEAEKLAPDGAAVVSSLDELAPESVDLVVECAGHEAVTELGEQALRLGADLMVISTGALADPGFLERLRAAARQGDSRVLIPAGAIAGLEGLGAMRRGGLDSVLYLAAKPPHAWRGTPAEDEIDLEEVSAPTTFFRGSAAEAARLYPKNANLAATVALAGLGLDETEIELVADPSSDDNVGRIEAEGRLGRLEVEVRGPPMPDNPKTSVITAYSVLEAIERPSRTIEI